MTNDAAIIDISHPIRAGQSEVWPGDTPPTREFLMKLENGDSVTLSTLHSTLHLGTHADGPCHYGDHAIGVGEMPLNHYLGTCRVLRVQGSSSERIGIDALADCPIDAPRILIDTGTFSTLEEFNTSFAAIEPEVIDYLADQGVITIGLDSPSVDLIDSKTLPTHARCLERGMAILETLRLSHVEPGLYTLAAQPLMLMEMDASPVRAVLMH